MEEKFILETIRIGKIAEKHGDVPIGAVIVKDNKIISVGYNKKHAKNNVLMHAEIIAINKACKKVHTSILSDCDIYVNFEPCLMCTGAILSARISNVFFGAFDKRFGTSKLFNNNNFNHECNVVGGILEEKCSKQITEFFKNLRKK